MSRIESEKWTNNIALCAGMALFGVGVITCAELTAMGEGPPPVCKVYDCLRTPMPPIIDGEISDSCWTAAPWARVGANDHPRVGLLWDDVYLYFAAEISDATPRCVQKQRGVASEISAAK